MKGVGEWGQESNHNRVQSKGDEDLGILVVIGDLILPMATKNFK